MKFFQCVCLVVVASILVGCKSTLRVQSYQAPAAKLRSEGAVFIVVPQDAYDEPGSGKKCADTMLEAFRPYASRLKLSDEVATLGVHLTNSLARGFTYVLDTKINRWEEEPTEWTGKPDSLDLEMHLLQTQDGMVVSATHFDGKSKWATFGGDHVEHLLKPLADGWVRAMYEGTDFNVATPNNKTKR